MDLSSHTVNVHSEILPFLRIFKGEKMKESGKRKVLYIIKVSTLFQEEIWGVLDNQKKKSTLETLKKNVVER